MIITVTIARSEHSVLGQAIPEEHSGHYFVRLIPMPSPEYGVVEMVISVPNG